jgi:hypothetical protein
LALGSWMLFGASLYAVLNGLMRTPIPFTWERVGFFTASLAVACVAGFLVLIMPSGVGVREFFLTLFLAPEIRHWEPGASAEDTRSIVVHLDEQYVARRSVRDLPATIADLSTRLSKLTADEATAKAHDGDPITIAGRSCSREDVSAMLAGQLDALPRNVRDTTRKPLGIYRGLRFGLVLHPQFPPDVYLEGAIFRQSPLSRDHHGPRAVLNALERLAGAYGSECVRVRQDLAIAESQLRDYQARLGKPFLLDAYLSELTSLRDQLKAGLSSTAQQSDREEGPSVSDLAERIKSLKAAHSIEAAPQRVRQKQSTAEEPVTARIRRRTEAVHASDPAIRPDAAAPGAGAAVPPDSEENSAGKPAMTFQERITMERRHDQEPSIPQV